MENSKASSTRKKSSTNEIELSFSTSLAKHIRKIKKARRATEKICSPCKMDVAQASIEILWEIIFDYLCSAKELTADEMSSLSSVVQRLASSRVQLANFTAKAKELSDSSNVAKESISESSIEKIENILKLL